MRTGNRRTALVAGLLIAMTAALGAAGISRDTLWRVEQTCILNHQTTGSSFPCLDLNMSGGMDRGVAILRAPFDKPEIIAVPTARVSGLEDPALLATGSPNYFQAAWDARQFVQSEVKRPLVWTDFGLAVNSRLTRSQDQLHIHVDCVKPGIRLALAERVSRYPPDSWASAGPIFPGEFYLVRRIDRPSLSGVNVFQLATEVPGLREKGALTGLAVIGVSGKAGSNGFVLLAGLSGHGGGRAHSASGDLLGPC